MRINKRTFQLCIENFQTGNKNIDYAFRNVMVMDGEEERVRDTFETTERCAWQRLWYPQLSIDLVNQLEFEVAQEDWSEVAVILKPFISNKRLCELDDALWADLLFLSALSDTQWELFAQEHSEYVKED